LTTTTTTLHYHNDKGARAQSTSTTTMTTMIMSYISVISMERVRLIAGSKAPAHSIACSEECLSCYLPATALCWPLDRTGINSTCGRRWFSTLPSLARSIEILARNQQESVGPNIFVDSQNKAYYRFATLGFTDLARMLLRCPVRSYIHHRIIHRWPTTAQQFGLHDSARHCMEEQAPFNNTYLGCKKSQSLKVG